MIKNTVSKFKAGDMVVLPARSDIWMTVNNTYGEGEHEQTVCIWFDTKNRLQRVSILTSLLQFASPSFSYGGQGGETRI